MSRIALIPIDNRPVCYNLIKEIGLEVISLYEK